MYMSRRLLTRVFPLCAALVLVYAGQLTGCGGSDEESFDNLPDCVDDHSSLTEAEAIAHCLVDFPDLHPEFANQQECVDFVTENGGYPDSRDDACTDYFEETGG